MVRVTIEYQIEDKKDRTFRSLGDIANDVERELWESPFFSEASSYQIFVKNEKEYVFITHQKEK